MQVYRTYALLLLSTPYHHDQTELQPPLSFLLLFYILFCLTTIYLKVIGIGIVIWFSLSISN